MKVSDANGVPVPNYLVNFAVVSGGGSLFVTAVNTSSAGTAKNRWTLGPRAGEQAIEVRAVDQTTGAPIVFATVTATARPAPVATLELYPGTAGFIATEPRDARDLVLRAADAFGNSIVDPPLAVTVTGGWSVSGTRVTAPQPWQEAQLTVTSGSISRTVKAWSVANWRSTRFTASFGCYLHGDTRAPQFAAEMTVDSTRYGRETPKWPRNLPSIAVMFASGTQRWQDGRTEPIRREILLIGAWADSLLFGVPHSGPEDGVLPADVATQYTARREAPGSKRFIGGTWCTGPDVLTQPNRLVLVEP